MSESRIPFSIGGWRINRNVKMLLFFVLLLFMAGGCAQLPDNSQNIASFAYPSPEETTLWKNMSDDFRSHPGQSAYVLLGNGLDAFVARAVLAHLAEHTIDAQYYLLHGDTVGGLFIDQLLKAADRGVHVRLLLDDMGLAGRDFNLSILENHQNIEVRVFNPFGRNTSRLFQFISGFGKQTRRAHNKSFTVDAGATIIGGRNIGNEYFVADPDLLFLDLDVLAIGPAARDVSLSFDQYWNHQLSYPISILSHHRPTPEQIKNTREKFAAFITEQQDSPYLDALRNSTLAHALREGSVQHEWGRGVVLADKPRKLETSTADTSYHLSGELRPYFDQATSDLLVISPYFVPGKYGIRFFKDLRKRGVRVRILTNSLSSNDVPLVYSGYANYRRSLLRMGVELYELNRNFTEEIGEDIYKELKKGPFYESKASLHTKAFVIDEKKVFIGSLNFDPRSVIQNTEIGIVINSEAIARTITNFFEDEIDTIAFRLRLNEDDDGFEYITWNGLVNGEQKTLFSEPYSGFWERFVMGLFRLLPIESQL